MTAPVSPAMGPVMDPVDSGTKLRETLEDRVDRLNIRPRDCRDCAMFTPSPTGLAFGWCRAHEQYVKLYHGTFFSQCQFKTLSRAGVGDTREETR